jgi:hypothetical protein
MHYCRETKKTHTHTQWEGGGQGRHTHTHTHTTHTHTDKTSATPATTKQERDPTKNIKNKLNKEKLADKCSTEKSKQTDKCNKKTLKCEEDEEESNYPPQLPTTTMEGKQKGDREKEKKTTWRKTKPNQSSRPN